MMTTSVPRPSATQEKDAFRIISHTSLVSGLLTLSAQIAELFLESAHRQSFPVFLMQGGPFVLLKNIAGAMFGATPPVSAPLLVAWGLVFHFMISFLFTTFLFLAYPPVVRLARNRIVVGIAYGCLVWLVMHELVIPFSKLHPPPISLSRALTEMAMLIGTVGAPVVWAGSRYYRRKADS